MKHDSRWLIPTTAKCRPAVVGQRAGPCKLRACARARKAWPRRATCRRRVAGSSGRLSFSHSVGQSAEIGIRTRCRAYSRPAGARIASSPVVFLANTTRYVTDYIDISSHFCAYIFSDVVDELLYSFNSKIASGPWAGSIDTAVVFLQVRLDSATF